MLLVHGMSGYTANMSTIATKIQFKLSGLFGKSGRYYEFREPLELIVEQVEENCWMHRIEELNLWAAEPSRAESSISFAQLFDEHYENYGMPGLKFEMASARRVQKQLQDAIKLVY
jgi:hypothetical protein